jgi:hypothetical protein
MVNMLTNININNTIHSSIIDVQGSGISLSQKLKNMAIRFMIWPINSPRKICGDVAGYIAGHWLAYALVSLMRRMAASTDAISVFL